MATVTIGIVGYREQKAFVVVIDLDTQVRVNAKCTSQPSGGRKYALPKMW